MTPLNFNVLDGQILLRTTPYSLLARDCPDRDVAFEVDDVDPDLHGGWSVLFRGHCHRQERMGHGGPPWVTGPRILGLRIDVRSVHGRRVRPPTSAIPD